MINDGDIKFYGYVHVNGNVIVKRYFGPATFDATSESSFVVEVFPPLPFSSSTEAYEYYIDLHARSKRKFNRIKLFKNGINK